MNRLPFFLATIALIMITISCNSEKIVRANPFFESWDTPFNTPPFDRIEDEDYLPALQEAMRQHNSEIRAIVDSTTEPTFESIIATYDRTGVMLSRMRSIFSMKQASYSSPTLQRTSEEIMPQLSAHYDAIAFNQELFAKVKSVYDNRGKMSLNALDSRLLDKVYNSFVRNGALEDNATKERLTEINSDISRLSVLFSNNLLAENNEFVLELDGKDMSSLPSSEKRAARERSEALKSKSAGVVTLQPASWIPFLTHSSRRDLREVVYKAYISRGDNNNELDNKQIASQIIRLRAEKAQLLGFNNYAEFVTDNQMSKSPEAVYSIIEGIYEAALERAKAEEELMKTLFTKDNPQEEFSAWDWWYYAEKIRNRDYNLDEENIKPYFSIQNVQRGVFILANRLFGLNFRPVPVSHYSPDCNAFEVLDIDGAHLGVLYLDLYARPTKRDGAWCGLFREQRYQGSERVSPHVGISCNFPSPSGNDPALLSLDETTTLFHEFGHALHFLFQDSKYRTLSRVEGDFVEFPSQILENWAFEPELLRLYAFHHKTNAVIPDNIISSISKSAKFNQGFKTTELAAAALSDMDIHSLLHGEIGNDFDINEFQSEVLTQNRGLIPSIEPRYRYPYFSHIFSRGYPAGYYFYLWAEMLDKDGFSAFVESGDLFNRQVATRLRKSILERGGTRDGMDMYREFRGKNPSKDALFEARGLEPV